jgi:hypothetical protein
MDADRIKGFFINHVEKIVFAFFLLGAASSIYFGVKKPSVLREFQPDKLIADARQVRQSVDEDHTESVTKARVTDFDIVSQTKKIDTPIDAPTYAPPNLWEDVDASTIVRRQDPDLQAPLDLRMFAVATMIAGTAKDKNYPLSELEAADKVKKEERRTVAPRVKKGQVDMEAMMRSQMGMGMGMGMEMEGMMESPNMPGGMGAGDGAAAASGPTRSMSGDLDRSGYRPVSKDSKRFPVPRPGIFISGVALLPYKEIYDAFSAALADAKGYEPLRRDTPIFHDLQVQRADVTEKSVADLVEADWVLATDRVGMTRLAGYGWTGFAPELVPLDYRDSALTMVNPPVLLDEYQSYTSHPAIPLKSKQQLENERLIEEQEKLEAEEEEGLEQKEFELADPTATPGMNMGGYGAPMEYSGMMGEMGGMMGAMMGQGQLDPNPVKYKLIRFYDFFGSPSKSPLQVGHKYVYRIRYGVVDPNFPALALLQPTSATLTPDVAKRVLELQAKAEADKSGRSNHFIRYSQWSEITPEISLPKISQAYVGPVTLSKKVICKAGNRTVEAFKEPAKAEIVATVLDLELGTKLPMIFDASPGQVLSSKSESIDVIDPVSLEIKKLPDAEVNSNITVIEVRGGEPFAVDEELAMPSEVLLMDASGKLQLADSVEQTRPYRTYSFADEKGK